MPALTQTSDISLRYQCTRAQSAGGREKRAVGNSELGWDGACVLRRGRPIADDHPVAEAPVKNEYV